MLLHRLADASSTNASMDSSFNEDLKNLVRGVSTPSSLVGRLLKCEVAAFQETYRTSKYYDIAGRYRRSKRRIRVLALCRFILLGWPLEGGGLAGSSKDLLQAKIPKRLGHAGWSEHLARQAKLRRMASQTCCPVFVCRRWNSPGPSDEVGHQRDTRRCRAGQAGPGRSGSSEYPATAKCS